METGLEKVCVIVAGQSNSTAIPAIGYDPDVDSITHPRLHQLGYGNAKSYGTIPEGEVGLAQYPMDGRFFTNPSDFGGWALSFGFNFVERFPAHKLLMVHAGKAGSGWAMGLNPVPNSEWDINQPVDELTGTQTHTLYGNLKESTETAIALGYTPIAMLWHQGEYNGYNVRDAAYLQNNKFDEMITAWRAIPGVAWDSRVIIGTVNHAKVLGGNVNQPYRLNVYNYQIQLPTWMPRSAVVDNSPYVEDLNNPTVTIDGVHFNAEFLRGTDGLGGMGRRYFDQLMTIS